MAKSRFSFPVPTDYLYLGPELWKRVWTALYSDLPEDAGRKLSITREDVFDIVKALRSVEYQQRRLQSGLGTAEAKRFLKRGILPPAQALRESLQILELGGRGRNDGKPPIEYEGLAWHLIWEHELNPEQLLCDIEALIEGVRGTLDYLQGDIGGRAGVSFQPIVTGCLKIFGRHGLKPTFAHNKETNEGSGALFLTVQAALCLIPEKVRPNLSGLAARIASALRAKDRNPPEI